MKMELRDVFDVFSRRPEGVAKQSLDVPKTTRSRIIQFWKPHFSGSILSEDLWQAFWAEILGILQLRVGTPLIHQAFGGPPSVPGPQDALRYVLEGSGEHFLDFLEDLFHTQTYSGMGNIDSEGFIRDINHIMQLDNLPYHLTNFATEEKPVGYRGSKGTRTTITAFPKVIMKESEVLHATAMEPALQLLRDPLFANANAEFLKALEDYRNGDFTDCLTKCGASFESFMKIICDKKAWPYKQTDTASVLVKTIVGNTSLENYFEQLLMIVATLRNRLSSAHGAGMTTKNVPQHVAQYAVNVTASAILLLAQETKVS
jgi:Abortive infection C-terminus